MDNPADDECNDAFENAVKHLFADGPIVLVILVSQVTCHHRKAKRGGEGKPIKTEGGYNEPRPQDLQNKSLQQRRKNEHSK